jgi:hypothetical protein
MGKDKAQMFWDEQAVWSEKTFGSSVIRGPLGPLKHLEKEAKEAQESAGAVGEDVYELYIEIADCLFLTFDAARRAGMTLDELMDTCFKKLEINKNRKWQTPTANGAVEHVRD